MKVYKYVNDCVTSVLGEMVQEESGREFFVLAEDLKELTAGYNNLDWDNAEEIKPA